MLDDKLEKPFKVLSIDGGGIKGLYSATILQHFEEKHDCLISDYFDLLCGTSTGGLIALAASLRIPMKNIVEFYENKGPLIFPEYKKKKFLSRIFKQTITKGDIQQILKGGKYSDEPLRIAIQEVFGEAKIGDSYNYLCIPSYTITESRPFIFKKDHHDLDRDDRTTYVDVALATTAAPTFFPLAEIPIYDYKQFIDGGVWANNPTIVGLLEALKYFVNGNDYDSVNILSISSLSMISGKPTGLKRNRSFLDWKSELFETSMIGQAKFTDYFMDHIPGFSKFPIHYFRVPSAEIASEQEIHIKLDVATPLALQLIKGKGNDIGLIYKKRPEISGFFKNLKLSKIR